MQHIGKQIIGRVKIRYLNLFCETCGTWWPEINWNNHQTETLNMWIHSVESICIFISIYLSTNLLIERIKLTFSHFLFFNTFSRCDFWNLLTQILGMHEAVNFYLVQIYPILRIIWSFCGWINITFTLSEAGIALMNTAVVTTSTMINLKELFPE